MDENTSINFEDELMQIKKIRTTTPKWLTIYTSRIHEHHKKFRDLIRGIKRKWSRYDYSETFGLYYYNLALLHYEIFYQHKINLKNAKIAIAQCLITFEGIRHLQNRSNRINDIITSATKLSVVINAIYAKIESIAAGISSNHHKATLIVAIGTSVSDELDLSTPEFVALHPKLFCIKVLDFISQIEEIFSQNSEKCHFVKYGLSCHLAEVYELCNQSKLYDYYMDISEKQLKIYIETMVIEDTDYLKKCKVQLFIKNAVTFHKMSFIQLKSIVMKTYTHYNNSLENTFIEQKYVKYLLKNYLKQLDGFINTMNQTRSQVHYNNLLLVIDKIKSIDDIPNFLRGDYYQLLKDYIPLITISEKRKLIRQFKIKCWNAIIPFALTAQKEVQFLKQIILYIRTATDPRLAITNLKIKRFCDLSLSTQAFVGDILLLDETNNGDLNELQTSAYAIKDQSSLFLMAKFVDTLHTYVLPVQPTVKTVNGRYVIELKGRLVIISEVYEELISLKTSNIQELHIVASDVHIDANLTKEDWSGINILIVSQSINIHGEITWDIGGSDGQQPSDPAANGIQDGEDGTNGADGFNGTCGGNIHVSCQEIINSENLQLKSIGGNGGNGQAGGNGMRGRPGNSVSVLDFGPLVTPPKPSNRILNQCNDITKRWSNNKKIRLNFLAPGHKFLKGTTSDGQTVTYSYFAGAVSANNEQYLLIEGSPGQNGGQLGLGGQGGRGGFGGEIRINCSQPIAVNIANETGKSGESGENGINGEPGANGSDMGHVYVNAWFSSVNEFIGRDQSSKIIRKFYKNRNETNFVYCCHREFCEEDDCYVQLIPKNNKQSIHERNATDRQDQRRQTHVEAVRINAISSEVIEKHEESISDDVINVLSNLHNKFETIEEHALKARIDEENQNDSEMTECQMRRQVAFDDTKFEFNRLNFKENIDTTASIDASSYIRDVESNPECFTPWFHLKNVYITYEHFQQLFALLHTHKTELSDNYGDIYCSLIEKYKYAICNRITEMSLPLNKNDKLKLDPVGNFLKRSSIVQDFKHEDLGVLNNFFRDTSKEQLEGLINYSEQLSLGSILYPIMYFLMEKCHNDEVFKRTSKKFTNDLKKFHRRLERLMACYQVALLEDRDSAILDEIKRQKLKIEERVVARNDKFIKALFSEQIRQHGVSSTSVRELLAHIFDCNIKIFVPNEHMQLILYHDHNPAASNVFYLLLENGGCTQLVMDTDYKDLVLERKNIGKYWSSVSSHVDKFVCKRQIDEFFEDLSLICIENADHNCGYCDNKNIDDLMESLLQHFPELSRANIENQINKLARKVGEGKGFLCKILRHFVVKKQQGVNPSACERKLIEFLENASLINIKLDVTTPHNCTYCRNKSDSKLMQLISRYFPMNLKTQVEIKLNKLTSKYMKDKCILCALLKRFDAEGVHVSFEELSYLVNAVLKSLVNRHTDLSTFQWILTAYPQEKWLNEIFYLELQNYFRGSLCGIPNLITNIRNIQQKDILLLMESKLCDETDKADSFTCIAKCLHILNETVIDIELIEKLTLSKWPYVFREQYLEYKLCEIATWEMEKLQSAMHFLIKLECQFGLDLIDKFLKIMLVKKSSLTSDILLEILKYFHTQEWSLNEEMLQKLTPCDGHKILEVLGNSSNDVQYEERSLDTLLNLIKGNSHTSPEICELVNTFHDHPCFTMRTIESLNASEIKKWGQQFKTCMSTLPEKERENFIRDSRNNILLMITQAIQLKRGFHLTKTQHIAILLLLTHNHSTLTQISTGEGKTLVVVAAAVFKAICNEKVDIITSSSVLAVRDAKINADIYELFGIKVSHNCAAKLTERKEAYSGSDVIYGTLSNFQRDYLLDRFYGNNIMGNRNFINLFVDEVDNMLLDKGNNTLYLSHDIPDLDKLESLYLFIWKKLLLNMCGRNDAGTSAEEILANAVLFDLHGTLSTNDLKELLKVNPGEACEIFHWLVDKKVLSAKTVCLQSFSKVNQSEIPEKYQLYVDKLIYITNNILNRVREIIVPKCFNNFIETHLNVWIKNAILASRMEDRQDYVLDVDRTGSRADISPFITIIDKGTGTDQCNSEWEEALHQFLQLKHGCKVSPQSLKAVFISNVTYFKKYQNLFGLTGTLGSETERDLLQTLYKVHFVNIPTAKQKRLTENQPILCESLLEWRLQIVNRTKALLLEQRSVLIICETIKEVLFIHKEFQSEGLPNIIAYKREYETCAMTEEAATLEPGHVIIATNLAGRGTDIKINHVLNEAGGLHVLLSYLPSNARIEQQAFGRAARSGCNGSAQLIVRGSGSFLDMTTERDMRELQRISDLKLDYDTRITTEESFFEEFTAVYRELGNNSAESWFKEIALKRIIDRWAYWLDENGTKMKEDCCLAVFRTFLSELKANFINWSTWNNDPVALIKLGIKHLETKLYHTAIEIFDFVITEEPVFCEAAHYYKAAALAMSLNFENRPFHGDDLCKYQQFLSELAKTDRKLANRKDARIMASTFVENLKEPLKNSFVQIDAFKIQQEHFINIYDTFSDSIQSIIGRVVSKSAFKNEEIDDAMSAEIYDGLIDGKFLRKARVNPVVKDDLLEISTNYGISVNTLLDYIRRFESMEIDEDAFLQELKTCIKLPTLEDFWDTLIQQNKLKEETVFVIVNTTQLINDQEDLLNAIPKLTIDTHLNDKKQVYMKRVPHVDDPYVFFEIDTFKTAVGLATFEQFERQGIISINKIATVDRNNCTTHLNKFDYIEPKDLESDNISTNEINDIFEVLTENGTLTESQNRYRFVAKYDETDLNRIHVYNQSVVNVFRIQFSYKNALDKMLVSLKENDSPVFIDLTTEPHTSLMWDIIEKNIIEPVKVAKMNKDKITDIVKRLTLSKNQKTYVDSVLNYMISSLERIECPAFNVIPIEKYFQNMQTPPLEELHACKLNGFGFILTTENKKWTRKTILSVSSIIVLAIAEVALGFIIQLASLGLATHIGTFMIGEGIADLIYTVNCGRTGYFSWESYKDHKLKSILLSISTVGIGKLISFGASVARFGSKIITTGAVAVGEEVVEVAGKELFKRVALKNACIEAGKILTAKSCEIIITNVIDIALINLIESYLESLFTALSDTILNDAENELLQHPLNDTLEILYQRLGQSEALRFVMDYTASVFSEAQLSIKYLDSCLTTCETVCSTFADIIKSNKYATNMVIITILKSALNITKFTVRLKEIRQIVHKLLNDLHGQMLGHIDNYINPEHEPYFEQEEFDSFKLKIISKWKDELTNNAQNMFERNVRKPSMDQCLRLLMANARKRINKSKLTKINNYNFKNNKLPLIQLKSLHVESKTKLIRDYQESLMKLRSNTNDYNLYADLIYENSHMDTVCLKAFLNSKISGRAIKICVETQDSGIAEEYHSEDNVGDLQIIRLTFKNNHYTNKNGEANVGGYDCLYHALVIDLPELQTISPGEFRRRICNTIRTNSAIQHLIEQGHHCFSISKKPYGDNADKTYSTKQIHDELLVIDDTNTSTQRNTSDVNHLCGIDPIRNKPYFGNPVNASHNKSGGLTFIINRPIMAVATVNNPEVPVDVRFFGNDELMFDALKFYKKKETVAKMRIGNSVENVFTMHLDVEIKETKRYFIDPRNYINWSNVKKAKRLFWKSKKNDKLRPGRQRSRSASRV